MQLNTRNLSLLLLIGCWIPLETLAQQDTTSNKRAYKRWAFSVEAIGTLNQFRLNEENPSYSKQWDQEDLQFKARINAGGAIGMAYRPSKYVSLQSELRYMRWSGSIFHTFKDYRNIAVTNKFNLTYSSIELIPLNIRFHLPYEWFVSGAVGIYYGYKGKERTTVRGQNYSGSIGQHSYYGDDYRDDYFLLLSIGKGQLFKVLTKSAFARISYLKSLQYINFATSETYWTHRFPYRNQQLNLHLGLIL